MTAGWRVEITPHARRDLRRLDNPIERRVLAALAAITADPPRGDLKRLRGSDAWRLRVGDWRVRLTLDQPRRTIVVEHVLPRGRAYRD